VLGALPDQTVVQGVLAQIEALGLELLELRTFSRHRAAKRHDHVAIVQPASRDARRDPY
jgi:hypothetical protein